MKNQGVVFNNTNYPLSNLIEMVDANYQAAGSLMAPLQPAASRESCRTTAQV